MIVTVMENWKCVLFILLFTLHSCKLGFHNHIVLDKHHMLRYSFRGKCVYIICAIYYFQQLVQQKIEELCCILYRNFLLGIICLCQCFMQYDLKNIHFISCTNNLMLYISVAFNIYVSSLFIHSIYVFIMLSHLIIYIGTHPIFLFYRKEPHNIFLSFALSTS